MNRAFVCGVVDVVLAYFITTRLWFMQNCIIHNHGFHQRSQSNYLARLVFQYCGSGVGKNSGSGSGMNNPDHISECLETIFLG
jgi:hypothetical protein